MISSLDRSLFATEGHILHLSQPYRGLTHYSVGDEPRVSPLMLAPALTSSHLGAIACRFLTQSKCKLCGVLQRRCSVRRLGTQ